MILSMNYVDRIKKTCPHTRGDDPSKVYYKQYKYTLVPTRVGMIPSAIFAVSVSITCPHTRGDDPQSIFLPYFDNHLSPHAWG